MDKGNSNTTVEKIKKWGSGNPVIAILIILSTIASSIFGIYKEFFEVSEIINKPCIELISKSSTQVKELELKSMEKLTYYTILDIEKLLEQVVETDKEILTKGCDDSRIKLVEVEELMYNKVLHFHISSSRNEKDYRRNAIKLAELFLSFLNKHDQSNLAYINKTQELIKIL